MSLTFNYSYPASYDIYQRLIYGDNDTGQVGTPQGEFYLNTGLIVPFSYNPSDFILSTDNNIDPVVVQISRTDSIHITSFTPNTSNEFIIYPIPGNDQFITTVLLQLGKGKNEIIVTQDSETIRFIITTTYYATILLGFAEDLFNYSINSYDQQKNAIFSPIATRLAEPLLDIENVLPNINTLQKLALKIATRVYTNESGSQSAVRDYLSGLIQSTPYFQSQKNVLEFDPPIIPIFRAQEDFSGNEAHVWIPNVAINRWIGFLTFINNMDNYYDILKVTENEVIIKKDGVIENHRFDFDSELSSLFFIDNEKSCYDTLQAFITQTIQFDITFCAAGYSFDLFIQYINALFGFDIDTYSFIGLSLIDRLDGGFALDTSTVPASTWVGGNTCVYSNGYHAQVPLLSEVKMEVIETITGSGTLTISVLGVGFGMGGFGSGEFGE